MLIRATFEVSMCFPFLFEHTELINSIQNFIDQSWAKIIQNDYISSLEPHLNIIGLCYYKNVVKEEQKNTNIDHSQSIYENACFARNKKLVRT